MMADPRRGSDNVNIGYVCSCFFTDNIFLKDYGIHVTYHNKSQFMAQYNSILRQNGCVNDDQLNGVLTQIAEEVERRKRLPQEKVERRLEISQRYIRLKPHIYCLQESFLVPEFLNIMEYCRDKDSTMEELEEKLNVEKAERCYSFPVFTEEFCNDFMDEISHFENSDLPKGRPNTMNHYGVLLDELGFDEGFLTPFRERFLNPLTKLLYPEHGGGDLDSHKAFIVKYKMGEDLDLSYHYDNAEITLNICLGRHFTGGGLYIGSMRLEDNNGYCCYENKRCTGLLHRGQHMHGASPITSGERYNLIIWIRSSTVRNKLCPMCNKKPSVIRTCGIHDGFSGTVDVCSAM